MAHVLTEIIAIGNELLIGDVSDTNTQWLAQRITGLGGQVVRSTMVRDEPAVIGEVLCNALSRATTVVFTSGGLGPTNDDMTLASISAALGRPLREHPHAVQMLEQTYQRFLLAGYVQQATLTPERRKMAGLPEGGEPLANPVGAAPGVVLQHGSTTIICLPGVPAELKGIFEGSLPAILSDLYGEACWEERSLLVNCGDESSLAPLVNRLADRHRDVYVKSRAKPYGPGVQLTITLSAGGASKDQVSALLEPAAQELREGLLEQGVEIVRES